MADLGPGFASGAEGKHSFETGDEGCGLEITFVGGPLDGHIEDIPIKGIDEEVIYWPLAECEGAPSWDQRVEMGLLEYVSRGDGKAYFVTNGPKV